MLESISSYIKNIAFFLIFTSFIGIILPNGKYKKYIDIVLGLILIIMMLEPLAGFVFGSAGPFDKVLNEITSSLDYDIKGIEYAPGTREQIISESFGERIRPQLESLVKTQGYNVEDFDFSINIETGELLYLSLTVSYNPAVTAKSASVPFIRVEKVRVTRQNEATDKSTDEESAEKIESGEINEIKKAVADFYNISLDNIHINVLRKN